MTISRVISRAAAAAASSIVSSAAAAAVMFPAKQVTRSNFESALADLRRQVRAADFVAIDLEMTGVTSAPWRECFEFDRSDVRYLKVKDSAEKFAVVQLGVVPFRWDSDSLSFVAYPHNFYVFPRQELTTADSSSYEFLCQTASIDFLAKFQFDFNACIREGISYLSRRQESEATGHLNSVVKDESSNLDQESKDNPLTSVADILFSKRIKKRFGEWRDWLLQPRAQSSEFQFQENQNDSRQQLHTRFFKMRPAVFLDGFTTRQLGLIQLVIRKNFEDLYYVHAKDENGVLEQLVVYTDSKADRDSLMKERRNERKKEAETKIQTAIGLRHVIDLLSSEQKLIVGHNCFLDIAHIYHKFIGPLPSTPEEFVTSVNTVFPNIIDTKILLNTNYMLQERLKKTRTSLSSAFAALCPHVSLGYALEPHPMDSRVNVVVEVDETRSSYWNSVVKHEAGYDAFMTGCIFSQICNQKGIDFKLRLESENLAFHEKLQKHVNLLYLSWTNADIIDLRTGQKVPEPFDHVSKFTRLVFENIVLIWGFPSKLKARGIKQCIAKVFGSTAVISVYHLDETAVFVDFARTEDVSRFLKLQEEFEKPDDPTLMLNPMMEIFQGGNTRAASYEVYKEICASPISKVLFADQAEALGMKWKTAELAEKPETGTASVSKNDSYESDLACDKILTTFYDVKNSRLRT